jgi:uncharacterized protein YjiS (DUF1127 family)
MSLTDNFRTNSGLSYRQATPAGQVSGQISSTFARFAYFMLFALGRAAKPDLQASRSVLFQEGQGLAVALSVWRTRRYFRKELSRLLSVAPHMIADIGLTVEDAAAEAARPFWRV